MKKTVMSVILLVATGLPVAYGQAGQTPPVAMKKRIGCPLSKFLISSVNRIPFLCSSTDFKDIKVDENAINYSSWNHQLRYLKKFYPIEYEIKNNTVVLRKTSVKLISQSENFPIPKILFRCRRKD
jgi:iron complex outermembrane receptor protein